MVAPWDSEQGAESQRTGVGEGGGGWKEGTDTGAETVSQPGGLWNGLARRKASHRGTRLALTTSPLASSLSSLPSLSERISLRRERTCLIAERVPSRMPR